jgi:3'-phosphoadenosine 5'-phosphosulfate sulfotransferase (PAPS reductase)/FAD synthetase
MNAIVKSDFNGMQSREHVSTLATVDFVRAAFLCEIDAEILDAYRLPITNHKKRVLVGLSGGADSAVLALLVGAFLSQHYPNIEFIFTDTLNEPASCYETLLSIEKLTGIPIVRLTDGKGLYGLIEQYNGFLPNSRARYCTRQLKITPLMDYMAATRTDDGDISLAGIRADEANREGIQFQYNMENGSAAFPLVDLGITREMVFRILEKTIGIPAIYRYKSRSGCSSCFFQRSAEFVGMLAHDPQSFTKSESLEKLSEADAMRWLDVPVPLSQQGVQAYYPVPDFIDIRKSAHPLPEPASTKKRRVTNTAITDMFADDIQVADSETTVYAAFGLYVDARLAWFGGREFTPGVYSQEFITISTSLTGLKTSLAQYHRFRVSTPLEHLNVHDMHIVIVKLMFEAGTIDLLPPQSESYTWKKGIALRQLRHSVGLCQSVLEYHDLNRRHQEILELLEETDDMDVWLVAEEQRESIEQALQDTQKVAGRVAWEGLYAPREAAATGVQMELLATSTPITPAREGIEYDEVPMACLACSI